MAEQFIEEIYSAAQLPSVYKRGLRYLHSRDFVNFRDLWGKYADNLISVINDWKNVDEQKANQLLEYTYGVKNSAKNTRECAYILEHKLMPMLYEYLEGFGGIDVEEGKWQLSSAVTGLLTLKDMEQGIFIHDLDDPMIEAWDQAEAIYDPSYKNAIIVGAGLGYLPYQLWQRSRESLDIYVLECDEKIVEYARHYGVLDWIDESKLHVIVKNNSIELVEEYIRLNEVMSDKYTLISDWMIPLYEGNLFNQLSEVHKNSRSELAFRDYYRINYYQNKSRIEHTFDELAGEVSADDWIVVAAGPSLDENIDFIRANVGKKKIIVVNTALRRLLNAGITPDYVTLFDATVGVYNHIAGIEEQTAGIPLIVESSAFWKYVANYKGPKYRVLIAKTKQVYEEAEDTGAEVWTVGATVSNLAIEIAVRLGAKNIYLVGLDLAFPGNQQYAGSTSQREANNVDNILVKSNNGGMVTSDPVFVQFRRDVENQIRKYNKVRYVNMSQNGAWIEGTKLADS